MELTTRTAEPQTITVDDLEVLEATLKRLMAVIDDEHCVPERYENTAAGTLASFDADHLSLSLSIVQRIARTLRFPNSGPRYFAPLPSDVEPIASRRG